MIRVVTLGVALGDADHKVREEGGNNKGPRVRMYLDNAGIAVAAPWCAAAVQYWADVAARGLGISNPLDVVKLEALVQSYFDTFKADAVLPKDAEPGDLALFRFDGSERWNHIGLVAQPPAAGSTVFFCVEGNTGDVSQRDGDGVYLKPRDLSKYPTCFIRWAA